MPKPAKTVTEKRVVRFEDEVKRWLDLGPYHVSAWPMRIVATGEWVTEYGVTDCHGLGMTCTVVTMTREAAEMAAASRNREKWESVQMHNRVVGAGKPFSTTTGWLKRRGYKWVRDHSREVKP